MESFGLTTAAAQVYGSFATIVATMLGVAGLCLAVTRRITKADLSGVFKTWQSWLVMAPLPFITILLGREVFIVAIALISVAAFREFAKATGLIEDKLTTWLVQIAIGATSLMALVSDPRLATDGWYGMFIAMPVYVVTALAIIPVFRNQAQGQLHNVSLAVLGYLFFGWLIGHLGFLANAEHAVGYVLYLLLAVGVADISAFICGKAIGRRKLCSNVSPNKTIGGSLGSLVVSMTLPWLFSFALPGLTACQLLLVGLVIGVGAQLGDLTLSYIKRDIGIKDMGQLIPGHGGLLDRVDSLIFTAPLFFHIIRWFSGV